ncbi:MAG: hypothetical protein QM504_03270 [Pseudomonadota bacterium]
MRFLIICIIIFTFKVDAKFEISFYGEPVPPVDNSKTEVEVEVVDSLGGEKTLKLHNQQNIGKSPNASKVTFNVNNINSLVFAHKESNDKYSNKLNYIAQLGAFGDPLNSSRFFKKMKGLLGDDVYILKPTNKNNLILTYVIKVLDGNIENELASIKSITNIDAYIKHVILNNNLKGVHREIRDTGILTGTDKPQKSNIETSRALGLNTKMSRGLVENTGLDKKDNSILLEEHSLANYTPLYSPKKAKDAVRVVANVKANNTQVKSSEEKYFIKDGRTLVSTLNDWLPDTSITFSDNSRWVKNIVFNSFVDCGIDKNQAVIKMQNLINNNPTMIKRHIHVLLDLNNNKLEISHES